MSSHFRPNSTPCSMSLCARGMSISCFGSGVEFSSLSDVSGRVVLAKGVNGLNNIVPKAGRVVGLFRGTSCRQLCGPVSLHRRAINRISLHASFGVPSNKGSCGGSVCFATKHEVLATFSRGNVDNNAATSFCGFRTVKRLPVGPGILFSHAGCVLSFRRHSSLGSRFCCNVGRLTSRRLCATSICKAHGINLLSCALNLA